MEISIPMTLVLPQLARPPRLLDHPPGGLAAQRKRGGPEPLSAKEVVTSRPGKRGIRAVLSDAGDLLYHRPRKGERLAAFLSELDLSPSPASRRERDELKAMAMIGTISRQAYRDEVLRSYGIHGEDELSRGRQVLEEETAGRFRFSHDKIREITYEQIERLRLRYLQHRSVGTPRPNQQIVDEHMLFPLLHARAGGGMPVKVVLAPPTGSAPEVCLTVDECVLINMGVRTVIYAEPPVTIDKQIPGANGPF